MGKLDTERFLGVVGWGTSGKDEQEAEGECGCGAR
jgi:hypothetical protein